jgi:hypothetical protein
VAWHRIQLVEQLIELLTAAQAQDLVDKGETHFFKAAPVPEESKVSQLRSLNACGRLGLKGGRLARVRVRGCARGRGTHCCRP